MHRLYENSEITVFWDSDKCAHARKCVTGCPQAFDFSKKPWIALENADNAAIWRTVESCPSGALRVIYNHGVMVVFENENSRSAAYIDGNVIGECDFEETENEMRIYHTGVLPEYGGKGIAKRLLFRVFEEAEHKKKRIVPICPLAAKLFQEDTK